MFVLDYTIVYDGLLDQIRHSVITPMVLISWEQSQHIYNFGKHHISAWAGYLSCKWKKQMAGDQTCNKQASKWDMH
jgi:hypothetical protein